MSKEPKAQDILLLAANVLAGAFDFMEDIEKGETPLTAATKAIKKGKKRAKALKKSAKEVSEMTSGVVERRRVIDVQVKPLFVLCACGCGLPDGQCQGRSAGGRKR